MTTKEPIGKDDISLEELFDKAKDWYSYFLSHLKIILLAAIIGSCLGLTYSFVRKPVYTASLSFALEDDSAGGGFGGALGLASSFGFALGGSGGSIFSGSNLMELFKSRKMVEQTLLTPVEVGGHTISLAEMYIQDKKWREKWAKKPKLKGLRFLPNLNRSYFTRVHDSIFGIIYGDLSKKSLTVVQKDKKIDIISIDVSTTNELFSKYFCESLARQVGQYYIEAKSKKARLNMAILEKQTDSIREELNSAITGVAVSNDNTFNLNPALNIRRAPTARRQVDVQANTAILTELVKQAELAKVTLRKETPLIQILDGPILPLKVNKVKKSAGIVFGCLIAVLLIVVGLILKRRLEVPS